ncbi:hypothetical protein K701_26550 [Streptomyces fradiae ATCC 10745 = DSM 40063]|uniref:Chromosome partition protein Smc n=1 Tax=Streptomyces fradiae ATCC 10745 = DSM 40063 TaxID=1319510 RepID=A0ABQ6XM64_STRFR|nr:hypothetical protein [Streptomyces sp. NRRL WC-3719]KAF0646861.1 hypothetical protein K701_26550 [Streptomyces fradiae ATCC 10745 = DSM 40063]QEV10684.1 hypothetical protein CP974_00095 [Streptomyces fradiae ATCC 10745 = DSM 40063]
MIERLEFQRGDVWYARYFRGLVTFLVGHSKAGKSTALEALLYPLGLLTATVMPEVRGCQQVRLVFRVAGTRWQATRSGSNPRARVSLKNLDDTGEIEHLLPVTSAKAGEMTAGAFVQDLLGLPQAARGATRTGLDDFYGTVMALRQNTIASEFLGGGKDEARVLALEVLLGLWNEDLAGLEKNASEAASRYRAARSALAAFKKLRDSGALADPASVRAAYEQKQREHHAAAQRWQKADAALKIAVGERGRLVALHQATEAQRRKSAKQAVAAHAKVNGATAEHAHAEGELATLLGPTPQDCTCCGQPLPDREPGLCRQCGQPHDGAEDRRERQIAAARAKVDRLLLRLRSLQEASAAAADQAAEADTAAAAALTARDAYDEAHLQPARKAAQQAEKEAHGLSRDVAQLKERLESADYISAQEQVIRAAKEQMDAAQAARDAAVTAHEVRRKEVTGCWSEFFLTRLKQINPEVETAHIDPVNFTTRVKERHTADKTFAESSVAGSPKVATNVALLLALRDLGRVDPTVRVPPLMIIDSPLAGLGAQGLDHDTGLRLIDTLIDIADDPSPDGYACQIIAATNDPLPRPYPGVREIRIDTDNRFFDHAPRRDN